MTSMPSVACTNDEREKSLSVPAGQSDFGTPLKALPKEPPYTVARGRKNVLSWWKKGPRFVCPKHPSEGVRLFVPTTTAHCACGASLVLS